MEPVLLLCAFHIIPHAAGQVALPAPHHAESAVQLAQLRFPFQNHFKIVTIAAHGNQCRASLHLGSSIGSILTLKLRHCFRAYLIFLVSNV